MGDCASIGSTKKRVAKNTTARKCCQFTNDFERPLNSGVILVEAFITTTGITLKKAIPVSWLFRKSFCSSYYFFFFKLIILGG